MSASTTSNPNLRQDRGYWVRRFEENRAVTEGLAARLSPEDQTIQSMADASPTKWHLAHTTWFFETFVLEPHLPGYRPFDPAYRALFNSYYETIGRPYPRPRRGVISRPGVGEIAAYRAAVTEAVVRLIWSASGVAWSRIVSLIELGVHHEEQHQELILMDIKHAFFQNPLRPAYRPQARLVTANDAVAPLLWSSFPKGLAEIGADGSSFCFDNELPRHRVWLESYRLASRAVSAGEYSDFIADKGYQRPELWLSDGWAAVQSEGWTAPLYWEQDDGRWTVFTLGGVAPLDLAAPVCHVSYYEADAYARWAGKRLPTEAEWERAATYAPADGHFLDRGVLHPTPAPATTGLTRMMGDVWEWTRSAYEPYPGFRAPDGSIGEYNGKFMSGQMTLRGGACVTPPGHARASYRNFFPPAARWAFSGVRLAEDS